MFSARHQQTAAVAFQLKRACDAAQSGSLSLWAVLCFSLVCRCGAADKLQSSEEGLDSSAIYALMSGIRP